MKQKTTPKKKKIIRKKLIKKKITSSNLCDDSSDDLGFPIAIRMDQIRIDTMTARLYYWYPWWKRILLKILDRLANTIRNLRFKLHS